MLCLALSEGDPLGFAGVGDSRLLPGCDPTNPGAAADCEYAGVVPTTATNMLMRPSVKTRLNDVIAFIESLHPRILPLI